VPVAHSIYGIPTTINSANFVYFLAMDNVVKLNNFDALRVFTGTVSGMQRPTTARMWNLLGRRATASVLPVTVRVLIGCRGPA
jgi:hypothetical protein